MLIKLTHFYCLCVFNHPNKYNTLVLSVDKSVISRQQSYVSGGILKLVRAVTCWEKILSLSSFIRKLFTKNVGRCHFFYSPRDSSLMLKGAHNEMFCKISVMKENLA